MLQVFILFYFSILSSLPWDSETNTPETLHNQGTVWSLHPELGSGICLEISDLLFTPHGMRERKLNGGGSDLGRGKRKKKERKPRGRREGGRRERLEGTGTTGKP